MALVNAGLIALVVSGVPATGRAQAPDTTHGKKPQPEAAKDRPAKMDMREVSAGRHHVLAMAYRDNLATFARALRGEVLRAKTVDLDMARPAVAEMRRSFDEMRRHHRASMPGMDDSATDRESRFMRQMETRLTAISGQLTALEAEVRGGRPDPRRVSDLATGILKHAAGMPAMQARTRTERTGK